MSTISFTATGDSFIVRPESTTTEDFQKVAALIKEGEVRFTNLETVIRRDEGFPAAQSGGTWASSPPEVLNNLKAYGFNLVAWANNHTLDFSYGGLKSTTGYLDEAGFVHAGVGQTLAEAGAIRYLETPSGRVALIAVVSSFHESWRAGNERPDGPGRPGVNPLRFKTVYHVPAEQLPHLEETVRASGINALFEQRVKEGFRVADAPGVVRLGEQFFAAETADKKGEVTTPHAGDLKRTLDSIAEAARHADSVLVSIHAHEGKPESKQLPADFLVEFSRACIDAGAHAVIGHGPHILRGIEIYQQRPIFYSLGNFIFHNESVAWQPADMYENYNIDPQVSVPELFEIRGGHGKRGLRLNPKVWESVIASWRMTDGELDELTLYPVTLGFGEPPGLIGTPKATTDLAALEDLQKLSEPFGTKLKIKDARLVWER